MTFITPVIDRTEEDIINKTTKAYYNISDFNRLEQNCAYLAQELGLNLTTKTWTVTDFPTNTDMQRILNNIKIIRANAYTFTDCPQNPQHPVNNYTKANIIERILKDVEDIYSRNKGKFDYMTEIYCGDDLGVI